MSSRPTHRALLGVLLLPIAWPLVTLEEREAHAAYDPLAHARAQGDSLRNPEAGVPAQCYTKTAGVSNPCWVCHTVSQDPNALDDWDLQKEYAFSDFALDNHWSNLFVDRSEEIARIGNEEIDAWIRVDNYAPLRAALDRREDYRGWKPDLDLAQGFDAEGFAKDGSGWRALRYHPFPGTFWPTNGNTDDVFVRLPAPFRQDGDGNASRTHYRLNLAILEAAIAGAPSNAKDALDREVEPVDEALAGHDLDEDGRVGGTITRIRSLPRTYAGGAADVVVDPRLHPLGTEYLHTVRYVDVDAPQLLSPRLKELRYSRKVRYFERDRVLRHYDAEIESKSRGQLPQYAGSAESGLLNSFGWQLQGYIEDAQGRLRLQSLEEQRFCMGCHSALGVTVDQTFTLPRKVPGAAGWRHQDLRGLQDRPQHGHEMPEIHTYFARLRGADEFRANDEMLARFFDAKGTPRAELLQRAAVGGDRDLAWLLTPSRGRARALNKAYLALVRTQSFELGRDTLLAPPANVHRSIDNGSTELHETGQFYPDGRLWLDWSR